MIKKYLVEVDDRVLCTSHHHIHLNISKAWYFAGEIGEIPFSLWLNQPFHTRAIGFPPLPPQPWFNLVQFGTTPSPESRGPEHMVLPWCRDGWDGAVGPVGPGRYRNRALVMLMFVDVCGWCGCHEFYLPINIGNFHHPNWIFFRRGGWTTNQWCLLDIHVESESLSLSLSVCRWSYILPYL